MCGFCGELNFGNTASASYRQMLGAMTERGPDASGIYIQDNLGFGIAA